MILKKNLKLLVLLLIFISGFGCSEDELKVSYEFIFHGRIYFTPFGGKKRKINFKLKMDDENMSIVFYSNFGEPLYYVIFKDDKIDIRDNNGNEVDMGFLKDVVVVFHDIMMKKNYRSGTFFGYDVEFERKGFGNDMPKIWKIKKDGDVIKVVFR